MAIRNYTFFSVHGNDYPVTANADGKLYMMLTGLEYGGLRLKHWTPAVNTALNRVYISTSFVVGGRYFELKDHSVALKPASVNFIHAVIDVSNSFVDPVTISVESSDTSNTNDINNGSGILKVCFEQVITSGSAVTSVSPVTQVSNFEKVMMADQEVATTNGSINIGNGITCIWQKKGEIVNVRWSGTLTTIANGSAFPNKAPSSIIPNGTKELIGHFASGSLSFHIDLETDGTFRWWGGANTGAARGSAVYFTK